MKKVAIAVCLFASVSGCASIYVHKNNEYGHPYAGVQNSLTTAPCNIALSGTVLFIYAPIFILDIPLSLVADTIYLPWDLASESKNDRKNATLTVKKHCQNIAKGMGLKTTSDESTLEEKSQQLGSE